MKRSWLGLVIIAAMVIFALSVYPLLPDRVPTHWNAAGEPDQWMARWPWAFLGPMVGFGIWVLLRLLPKVDPRLEHYDEFWDTYWLIGNLLIGFMALLQGFALGTALGWPIDVTRLTLMMVGLLLIVLSRYLPRVRSNWWLGVRTPWTLESERVWRETHRLAGRTFLVGGLITLGAVLVPAEARPWVALAGIAVGGFVPVVYSYYAWRRERRG